MNTVENNPLKDTIKTELISFEDVLVKKIPFPCFITDYDDFFVTNPLFVKEFCIPIEINFLEFSEGFEGGSQKIFLRTSDLSNDVFYHRDTGKYFQVKRSEVDHNSSVTLFCFVDISKLMGTASKRFNEGEQFILDSRSFSLMEMATTLAHEINQPLAAVMNFTEVARLLAEKKSPPKDKLTNVLSKIHNQVELCTAIICRIREFVENKAPEFQRHNIAVLVENTLEINRFDEEFLPISVTVDIAPSVPDVICDAIMIQQVLCNLIRNASDALRGNSPSNRAICISGYVDTEQKVAVNIRDNGSGIEDSQKDSVFKAFYTTKETGMGAGLAICRSFIELHQGRLTFSSEVNKGTEFSFNLLPFEGDDTDEHSLPG